MLDSESLLRDMERYRSMVFASADESHTNSRRLLFGAMATYGDSCLPVVMGSNSLALKLNDVSVSTNRSHASRRSISSCASIACCERSQERSRGREVE